MNETTHQLQIGLPPLEHTDVLRAAALLQSLEHVNILVRFGLGLMPYLLREQGWEEGEHSVRNCSMFSHSDEQFNVLVAANAEGRRENLLRLQRWQDMTTAQRSRTFDILDSLKGGTVIARRSPAFTCEGHENDPLWVTVQEYLGVRFAGATLTPSGPCYAAIL